MTEEKPIADIYDALLAVYRKVGYVQKTGKLEISGSKGYKYAGEADLIAALRPAMLEVDIIFWPSGVERSEYIELASSSAGEFTKNTYTTKVIATLQYTFRHVPSSTEIKVQVIGEGVDNGDKASYKAMTGALKYALRQTFLIETGDEPEADESTDSQYGKAVFKSNALRNAFLDQIDKQLDAAASLAELETVINSHKQKLDELKHGSEYDVMALSTTRSKYKAVKARLEVLEDEAAEGHKLLDDSIPR